MCHICPVGASSSPQRRPLQQQRLPNPLPGLEGNSGAQHEHAPSEQWDTPPCCWHSQQVAWCCRCQCSVSMFRVLAAKYLWPAKKDDVAYLVYSLSRLCLCHFSSWFVKAKALRTNYFPRVRLAHHCAVIVHASIWNKGDWIRSNFKSCMISYTMMSLFSLLHDQAEEAHYLKRHWMHSCPGLTNLWPEKVLSYMLYMISYMISLQYIWYHIMISYALYVTSYQDIILCLWYHITILLWILLRICDITIMWYHIIVKSHNCDITEFVMIICDLPW